MGVPFNGCVGMECRLKNGESAQEKNRFAVNSNKDAPHCHSRAGGNPDLDLSGIFKNCSNSKSLDSR
ncbi:hypothetical protein, partial [Neisseria gonorrhoeae]|uniref:hypothetical protein n=1 Tax=Neisseria gonorrhoeae TaxID=485 RepID=UPI0027D9A7A0